jgi:hypothetical protein
VKGPSWRLHCRSERITHHSPAGAAEEQRRISELGLLQLACHTCAPRRWAWRSGPTVQKTRRSCMPFSSERQCLRSGPAQTRPSHHAERQWIESAEMGKDMANKQSGPSSRSKEPSFGEFVARHERERAALEFLFPSEAAGTNTLATALQRRPSLPPPFRELKDHPCSDCLKRRLARTAEMHTRRIYWSGCAGWVPGLPGAAWKTRRGPKPRDGDDLREVDRNRRAETRSAEAWPRPSTEPLSHERLAINAS